MAEAALFGIAKSVLQQLASPALDEFRLLWGHKEQLDKLVDTVTTIADVLEDADRRQATDVPVKRWLARLRVALYDADDLFDLISAKVLLEKDNTGTNIGKKVRHFLSKPYDFAFFVKTAHKVKAIREHLDGIARDMIQFHFLPVQTAPDQPFKIKREQTHSYVPKDDVVGREKEKEEIVSMLLPECFQAAKRGVSVIAVIGIGGLGKTTLAQLAYNDERVEKGFDLRMWTCINYFSDLEQVLITLLKSATKGGHIDHELDQLQSLFRKEIEGKRFLLVLDDVWDDDPQNWNRLKILLDSGRDGSMVLATTRSVNVAQSVLATKPYFYLQGMSDESAWLLFKKIAFAEVEDQHTLEMEELGQQIVKKCANVPLAIVTIASLLRHKDKKKWFPLVNDELSGAAPDEYKKITHALEISYKELPYPVKRCFGYCSLFPKDYIFVKDMLVRLWIAQGFVEPCSANQSLEDRAEEYFFFLVERGFFQHTSIDEETKDVTCKMHDLMHDLAKEVAGFESILVDQIAHSSWDKTIRHLSINCRWESIVDQVCSFPHAKSLRTFLPLHKMPVLEKNALNKLISGLRSLRVLDLSDLGIVKVPTAVGELIHLRFLNLSENEMERLPSSICSLRHLQSLNLRSCGSLKELPKDLGNLRSLRHLVLEGCYELSQMPPGLIALTSLVTLDMLVVHSSKGGLKYLERLDNLSGSLEIVLPVTGWKDATPDAERSFLSRKSRLNRLVIACETRPQSTSLAEPDTNETWINALQPHSNLEDLSIQNFDGKKMVHWVMDLHNLVILKLSGCRSCVEIPSLSHLQLLKELHISDMSPMMIVVDNKVYDPNVFFPSLESLWIENIPNLRSWWVLEPTVIPAFPRATKVRIVRCPKLTACMPLFPLGEGLSLHNVREELMWQAIGSLTSQGNSVLKRLEISEVEGLSSISEAHIRHMSALQKLTIRECKQLETVSCNGLAHLTSLERLVMSSCEKLNKWDDWCDKRKPEFSLPRLGDLSIPNLTRNLFKGFKYMASLKELDIYNSFNKELQEEEEEEEEYIPWKHLQKLEDMCLVFGETFSMRSRQRLLHGFQHLTALQSLTLSKCKELYLSWRALLGLNHLRRLNIGDVEKVVDVYSDASYIIHSQLASSSIQSMYIKGGSGEWVEDIPWKSFPFLEYLRLENIRKLEGLPEGIQHLAALKRLDILNIDGIVSLPYWMTSLSSLETLRIRSRSSELRKRCEKLKGEDWPHIQHIRKIHIYLE